MSATLRLGRPPRPAVRSRSLRPRGRRGGTDTRPAARQVGLPPLPRSACALRQGLLPRPTPQLPAICEAMSVLGPIGRVCYPLQMWHKC